MYVDFTPDQLETYRSAQTSPEDLDQFWRDTLAEAEAHDLDVTLERVDSPVVTLDLYDVTFSGYAGERIKGWLKVPRESPLRTEAGLPAVVEYLGYSHGRGFAEQSLEIASSGFAHFVMDSRGQGWHATPADTPDSGPRNPGPPGFMTHGITSRETYYYRRLYTDAARAVAAAASLDLVDAARIGVTGGSQGGGLALAAAALVPQGVAAVYAKVPFLCDFPRAIRFTDAQPYAQIAEYCKSRRHEIESIERVLSYFDIVNLAAQITAPVHITASLMDATCPPATIFGAYHRITAPKSMQLWEFNGHEGGAFVDNLDAISFMSRNLSPDATVAHSR
ncbi:alpha/beta fold hydrolase [Micrococcales bacterium 31B]|nr:alpha/beta fold hydrolase [Micrococcales bacterium 31B]